MLSIMNTTTVFEDAEDATEGAADLQEADEGHHAVTNTVTRTEPVPITATNVVRKLPVIRLLQLLRTSREDLQKIVPLER